MASTTPRKDLSRVLGAYKSWANDCLVADGSVFSESHLWTAELVAEVKRAFVDHPDESDADFLTKLMGQMGGASSKAQQLMAEMIWALLLFPSNIRPATKRRQVVAIWELSGNLLRRDLDELSDDVLAGIGSAGPGFNQHRWRELAFLIELTGDLKRRSPPERQRRLSEYDAFMEWIEAVPREGRRQFRHILRYFAFPDRVERMASNRERRAVLEGFGVASRRDTRQWSDRRLDDALLELRRQLQQEHPGIALDFYESPLRARWQPDEGDEDGTADVVREGQGHEYTPHQGPVNLILFGPPGTGKTHWLQQKFREYTDDPNTADQEAWLQELVANYGWRAVIAVALADLRRPARVPELRNHRLVQAKARQRGRTGAVQGTLWGFLQEHTPETVATVRISARRPPFIFSKSEEGEWSLLAGWQELDEESAELERLLRAGPAGAREAIRRYRVVTFHPSFSYEEFVRGIRPVSTSEEGTTQFRMVDGIFKQICDEARVNPTRRYALFIDEINRANIAKVFGELITLIEKNKRISLDSDGRITSGMTVQLPGGDGSDAAEPPFGVPANLDIYGTMNTADRSIALLDIALRRRFEFREMEPEYGLLSAQVGAISLAALLRRINDRLEYLLDRDHRIGHAYLMGVTQLADLRRVFRVQIIPLLQEYFFDDLARVAAVLATAPGAPRFVAREELNHEELFSGERLERAPRERARYYTTPEPTWTEASFKGIYAGPQARPDAEEPA